MDSKRIHDLIHNNFNTYKEAQNKLNISRSQLYRILNGKTFISPKLIAALKKEFPDLDFGELLNYYD